MSCQSCGSRVLVPVASLGYLPPVNDFRRPGQKKGFVPFFPTDLVRCVRCQLVQLVYVPNPTDVFPASYPYRSGVTPSLVQHFKELAAEFALKPGQFVIDVGGNDGTLLKQFPDTLRKLNVEPTDAGVDCGVPTVREWWSTDTARKLAETEGKADLITACNVFAHTPDPNDFMAAVDAALAPDGVFVIECQYWPTITQKLALDTAYHEHTRHWSYAALATLFARHGFGIDDAYPIDTHAGSIRVFASRSGNAHTPTDTLERPGNLEADFKQALRKIAYYVSLGRKVIGIGAPSRGAALIHMAGITNLLDCVAENAASPKVGGFIPGTEIPVVAETPELLASADTAVLFSWHLADVIVPKIRAGGFKGSLVVPLPEPRLVTA